MGKYCQTLQGSLYSGIRACGEQQKQASGQELEGSWAIRVRDLYSAVPCFEIRVTTKPIPVFGLNRVRMTHTKEIRRVEKRGVRGQHFAGAGL